MSAPAAQRERLAWEWNATGTVWRLHHDGCLDAALAAAAAAAVEADEARWSRFRSDSEVARINAGAGTFVAVSPDTLELLAVCRSWQERSGGVFDPLAGGAVAAWGYTRSLAERRPYAQAGPDARPLRGRIELDPERGAVRVPAGSTLDLGGIGKGWIADRLARRLAAASPEGRILVDAGGDLVSARGEHAVAVGGAPGLRIPLAEGRAVASSSTRARRWRNGDGRDAHHLIDPETGAPCAAAAATVVAATGADADVLAKLLVLRPRLVAGLDLPARVEAAGNVRESAAWAALVGREPRVNI